MGEYSTQKIIPINEIVFEPSSRVLSAAQLNSVTGRYLAMEKVSLAELYQMVYEIDRLYDSQKTIGRASIPAQDVRGGKIVIQLLEGQYGNVQIKQMTPTLYGERRFAGEIQSDRQKRRAKLENAHKRDEIDDEPGKSSEPSKSGKPDKSGKSNESDKSGKPGNSGDNSDNSDGKSDDQSESSPVTDEIEDPFPAFSIFDRFRGRAIDKWILQPGRYHGNPVYRALTYDSQSVGSGQIIRLDELEDALQRYNMLYESKLRAELEPGIEPGTSDLILNLMPAKPIDVAVYADNFGRPSTGKVRTGSMMQLRNLSGFGDSWTTNVVTSFDGGVTNAFVSGRAPVLANGTMFTGSYEYNDFALVNGEYSVLEIDGLSRRGAFGLIAPLHVCQHQLAKAYMIGSLYESQNYFSQVPQQNIQVQSVTNGISYERFSTKTWTSLDGSIVAGSGWNALGERQNYSLMRLLGTYVHKINDDWSVLARGSVQWGWAKNLTAVEQFQLGGVSSVRGYSDGMLAGDSGYYINLELHRTLLTWDCRRYITCFDPIFDQTYGHVDNNYNYWKQRNKTTATLATFSFFDHGGAYPYTGGAFHFDTDDHMYSTSQGFLYNRGWNFQGRITAGVPLRENDLDPQFENVRVNFFAQYKF